MIAPYMGGIDVYVNSLAGELRRLGALVDIKGGKSNESAYDVSIKSWKTSEELKRLVENITNRINFDEYDIVGFNFGKNDIEQYIPVDLLDRKGKKIKNAVYFVHFLSWNLFGQYLDDQGTQAKIEQSIKDFFNHYVFFGSFAKNYLENKFNEKLDGIVNFLPETHSLDKDDPVELKRELKNLGLQIKEKPTIFLPGFAGNYKDYLLLLKAFEFVDKPINFIFAGLGWAKRLSFRQKQIGLVDIYVMEKYFNGNEYHYMCEKSLFGIFPYKQPADLEEVFQGSGTLPNFIYARKASIVLDEGCMPEYVGKGGIVIKNSDPKDLGIAINKLLDGDKRRVYEQEITKRAELFSIQNHAKSCLKYFELLLGSK